MESTKTRQHIAVLMIWFERYQECSRMQGTKMFTSSVWRFYYSLLNLDKKDLAIKDKVKYYIDNEWRPNLMKIFEAECKHRRTDLCLPAHAGSRKTIIDKNEEEQIVKLFEFIIQTIQDTKIGWPTHEDMQSYHISQE